MSRKSKGRGKPAAGQLTLDWGTRRQCLRDLQCSNRVKSLLRVLADHCAVDTNACFPKVRTIAKGMSTDPRTVQRAIREATELGFILVRKEFARSESGQVMQTANTYILRWAEMMDAIARDRAEEPENHVPEGSNLSPPPRQFVTPPVTLCHPPGDKLSPLEEAMEEAMEEESAFGACTEPLNADTVPTIDDDRIRAAQGASQQRHGAPTVSVGERVREIHGEDRQWHGAPPESCNGSIEGTQQPPGGTIAAPDDLRVDLIPQPGSEPVNAFDATSPFPCKSGTWCLPADKLAQYRSTYPTLDVVSEIVRARQWCIDNPLRRKTACGMPRFLTSWLNKALRDASYRRMRPEIPGFFAGLQQFLTEGDPPP